jgi:hypothetical protein
MAWLWGGLLLLVVAAGLRKVLRMGKDRSPGAKGLIPLEADREEIYQPIALEVETQAAILGISLNDAFEERDSGRQDIAWRMVQLSVGEWDRSATLVIGLLKVMARQVSSARVLVPLRGVNSHRFKSSLMIDYLRFHELLDQVVFSSRMRFQLHVRVLRRAAEILTGEFRRRYRYGERTGDRPDELWKQLDLYFHDFDLIAKETLLAFRTLLACLPGLALAAVTADVKGLIGRGVRSTSATTGQ